MLGRNPWLRYRTKPRTSRISQLSQNYYQILQVPENSTQSQIEAAFHERSEEVQRQRISRSSYSSEDEGDGDFELGRISINELGEAYRGLNNEAERRAYDKRMGLGRWNSWIPKEGRSGTGRERMRMRVEDKGISSEDDAGGEETGSDEETSSDEGTSSGGNTGSEMIPVLRNHLSLPQRLKTRHSSPLAVRKWQAISRAIVSQLLAQEAQRWQMVQQTVVSEALVQEAKRQKIEQEKIHVASEIMTDPIRQLEELTRTVNLKEAEKVESKNMELVQIRNQHDTPKRQERTQSAVEDIMSPIRLVKELVMTVDICQTQKAIPKRQKIEHEKGKILEMKKRGWEKWERRQTAIEEAQMRKSRYEEANDDSVDDEMEEIDKKVEQLEIEIEEHEKQQRARRKRLEVLKKGSKWRVEKTMKLREKQKRRQAQKEKKGRGPKIWVQQLWGVLSS